MTSFESEIMIDAKAEHVWPILADVEKWPHWTESFSAISLLNSPTAQLGARAKVKQPRLPQNVWTITDWQPQKSFAWETRSLGAAISGDHKLRENGDSCIFYQKLDFYGPLARLSASLGRSLIRRYMLMEAEGLKRVSEFG